MKQLFILLFTISSVFAQRNATQSQNGTITALPEFRANATDNPFKIRAQYAINWDDQQGKYGGYLLLRTDEGNINKWTVFMQLTAKIQIFGDYIFTEFNSSINSALPWISIASDKSPITPDIKQIWFAGMYDSKIGNKLPPSYLFDAFVDDKVQRMQIGFFYPNMTTIPKEPTPAFIAATTNLEQKKDMKTIIIVVVSIISAIALGILIFVLHRMYRKPKAPIGGTGMQQTQGNYDYTSYYAYEG